MGLLTVSGIVSDARKTLSDQGSTQRWLDADLVRYYNLALLMLAIVRPEATGIRAVVALAAGTRQTLPVGGLKLIKSTRNMAADGTTPGAVVTRGDEQSLAMYSPNWHTQTPKPTVKTYLYDDRDPKTFWVDPPSDGAGGKLEIVYSTAPTAETTTTVTGGALLAVDDIYAGPVKAWMLKEAFGVELSSLTSQGLSRQYEREFYQALGIKYQGDRSTSPNSPQPQAQLTGGATR